MIADSDRKLFGHYGILKAISVSFRLWIWFAWVEIVISPFSWKGPECDGICGIRLSMGHGDEFSWITFFRLGPIHGHLAWKPGLVE